MSKELRHIFCIDDESDILEVASLALEAVGGFRVTGFSNGNDAIAKALQEQPDLFLVDMMMPDMDGAACLQKIREEAALDSVPVVFMTARVQPSEVQEYVGMGAAGVIAKPFDPMGLSGEILKIWERCNG